MRVLVTGATGLVGSHTAAALVAAGHDVRLLVRDPSRIARALGPHGITEIDHVVGDVVDEASVCAAVVGCDAVVHSAAVFTLDRRRDVEVQRTNVGGTETVLGAAHAAGLDPIIHVSSVSALFPPAGPILTPDDAPAHPTDVYARSKADADRVARGLQGLSAPVTITYPGGVWGPMDPTRGEQIMTLIRYFQRGIVPVAGGFPLVDVRDIAAVHVAAMQPDRGPRRYMIGGTHLATADLFQLFTEVTGRKLRLVPVPDAIMRLSGRLGDLAQRWIGLSTAVTSESMETLTRAVPCDSSRTAAELGVQFRPPRETVADTLRWLYEEGVLSARHAGALATRGD